MEQQVIKFTQKDGYGENALGCVARRHPIHLILDNVRSAFNVGSAFRSADAALIEHLHLGGISAYPPNAKLEKTALGSTTSVPWSYYPSTVDAIHKLKQNSVAICAVELTSASIAMWQYQFPQPVALVFGHEVYGIDDDIIAMADAFVHIPMYGKKATLNVSTALGIVLFEVLRQWKKFEVKSGGVSVT